MSVNDSRPYAIWHGEPCRRMRHRPSLSSRIAIAMIIERVCDSLKYSKPT
ncbi:unnamed protein product [Trichogramma brassicae]|uniref:Uncharacterized protein n=1 Tax=Trichogramma brassicae TaxID=86971 RepID=A0A6H5II33_9HYME|nr:unnamed protein product [Trichogramma brassicae]